MSDPLDDLDALLALATIGPTPASCAEAGARLIAALRNAAPDLLAVARAADRGAASGFYTGDEFDDVADALAALRARLREGT